MKIYSGCGTGHIIIKILLLKSGREFNVVSMAHFLKEKPPFKAKEAL